ncbi:dienelactone hydrolase family protein [Crocinitomix catalasitica]|uniref:dienelactone hydrolase family protein n=1 Tax=Crocinitomix catalasitica TaxID=184607 RepID=UPI00056869F3|nr:dienelactone hydrolase family protein [Crocinitomix catalasitica]
MKNILNPITLLFCISVFFVECSDSNKMEAVSTDNKDTIVAVEEVELIKEKLIYFDGADTLIGYLFYNSDIVNKPGILVVHEWWGNNDYAQSRAEMLANLGYVAFAIDMYGNGLVVDNPDDAKIASGKIYSNPELLKSRMMAARETLIKTNKANSEKIAAIGYCFGGNVVLNAANAGVPLNTVVSFHGGLGGFKAQNNILYSQVLVCNGAADNFVSPEDIKNFKSEMDRVEAPYTFIEYADATHAFTNPNSTAVGEKFGMPIAYNEVADNKSWQDMLIFFDTHFSID